MRRKRRRMEEREEDRGGEGLKRSGRMKEEKEQEMKGHD